MEWSPFSFCTDDVQDNGSTGFQAIAYTSAVFGRRGHNGVSLCGTPGAVVVASTVIARIATAVVNACTKSDSDLQNYVSDPMTQLCAGRCQKFIKKEQHSCSHIQRWHFFTHIGHVGCCCSAT